MNQKPENFLSFSSSSSQITNNAILVTITVISIIVFISALLHFLIRFLLTPKPQLNHTSQEISTAFQGRLQTLFNLHDSGVDQSFIDTLPMFHYKTIIGLNQDPFDCVVCLSHFEAEDELRLLPNCSHAFHVACIDTWLLTNSTCPLCRDNLLDSVTPSSSPVVLVLESDSESSQIDESKQEIDERVVLVKLGKFKNIDSSKEDSDNNGETRRCFSMGYIEYVMPEDTLLQAPITVEKKKKKQFVSSLCVAGDSRIDANYDRKESFSMSKTWLHDGLDEFKGLAGRRTVSFRVPVKLSGSGDVGTEKDDGFPASLDTKSVSFTKRNMFWPWRQEKVSNSSSFVNNNENNV